jgi:hypothetical protein
MRARHVVLVSPFKVSGRGITAGTRVPKLEGGETTIPGIEIWLKYAKPTDDSPFSETGLHYILAALKRENEH